MNIFSKSLMSALGTMLLSSSAMATTLVLPATMDAGSVQAKLKNLLFSKIEAEGEITGEYQANLTGNYGEVTLEDKQAKVTCREFSAGQLAVQRFECSIELQDGKDDQVAELTLAPTMDAASVQALIKNVLFNELEANGPVTSPYEASLTGHYSTVKLADASASITCSEGSAGALAVQLFSCEFLTK
jgi:hypothetical protein